MNSFKSLAKLSVLFGLCLLISTSASFGEIYLKDGTKGTLHFSPGVHNGDGVPAIKIPSSVERLPVEQMKKETKCTRAILTLCEVYTDIPVLAVDQSYAFEGQAKGLKAACREIDEIPTLVLEGKADSSCPKGNILPPR